MIIIKNGEEIKQEGSGYEKTHYPPLGWYDGYALK